MPDRKQVQRPRLVADLLFAKTAHLDRAIEWSPTRSQAGRLPGDEKRLRAMHVTFRLALFHHGQLQCMPCAPQAREERFGPWHCVRPTVRNLISKCWHREGATLRPVPADFLNARYPMVALYRRLAQPDQGRLELAKRLLATPSVVAEAFKQTIKAMSLYDNNEPFYQRRREHRPAATLAATKDLALRLGPRATGHGVAGAADLGLAPGALDFSYVDRELLVTRTTKAHRDPGFTPPEQGLRLDVLLASLDRSPIVGEIKIKRDRDLSYALIQALACVSLLATANQRARLQRHYPELFWRSDSRPFDVYLIAVPRTDRDTFLSQLDGIARDLASELLKLDSITAVVRRVALIHASTVQERLYLEAVWVATS